MAESIVAGNLVLDLTVDTSTIQQQVAQAVRSVPPVRVRLDVDGNAAATAGRVKASLGGVEQQATATQQRIQAMFTGLGSSASSSARASAQAFREVAAEEARAARAGQQRLRDNVASIDLTSRLRRDAERQAQEAITATIRALDNQQRAQRNLWQSGKILGIDSVEIQRDIQTQALAAARALDVESDAYRRLTQVAAAAERTANSALGRNTPGGFSHGVTLGIQNSGLMNYAAMFGGPSAEAMGIVANSFTGAKAAALEYGKASNTAATATGLMTAAGATLTLGLGAAALGFGSLAATGLEQTKILQGGLNTLEANGVKDLESVSRQVATLKTDLGQVGKSFSTATLTAATADVVKAGLDVNASLTLMATSTKLASAENDNLNDSSMRLLENLRSYQQGVDGAAKLGNQLAQAGLLASGSAKDLSIGFNNVGSTAFQAGLSSSVLLGMLVELDNAGFSAANRGSEGLRSALSSLADITDEGRAQLETWGVATEDSGGKARRAGDILIDLTRVVSTLGIRYNQQTGELEGNGDALRGVASIMDTQAAAAVLNLTGKYRDLGTQIESSNGQLDTYVSIKSKGVEQAQKRLKTAFEDAGLAVTKGFAAPLADLMDNVITPGLEKLGRFATGLNDIANAYIAAGQGKAAFGAEEYSLPAWLKQTGLQSGDLTTKETADATRLLRLMQDAANNAARVADQWRKLGMEGQAQRVEQESTRQIGQLGVTLTELQRTIAARVQPDGYSLGAYGNLGSILQGLGVGAFGLSADYDGHTGKDVRTPEGTAITAGQNVRVESGFDKGGYGQYLKLIDRDGYQMILGHLKTIDAQLLAQIKEKGYAMAQAGQALGTTGGAKGAWYSQNSTGPHLHVEVRDPSGRVQNLDRFNIAATGNNGVTGAGASGAPQASAAGTDDQLRSLSALQTEFTKLKVAYQGGKMDVEAYQRAVSGLRGEAERLAATQATGGKEWTKTERFVIETGNALKTHAAGVKDATLTWAQWTKNREAALALAKREADLNDGKLSERQAIQVRQDVASYQKDPTRALALQEAERQLAERRRTEAEDKTAAANRLKTQRDLTEALARGNRAQAEGHLTTLRAGFDDALKLAGQDVARRAAVIRAQGPAIVQAEVQLANLKRDQAVKAARQTADDALKLPGADPAAVERARQASVRQAFAQATLDRAAARRTQLTLERESDTALTDQARTAAAVQVRIQQGVMAQLKVEFEARQAALAEGVRAGNEALANLDPTKMGGQDLAAAVETAIPAGKTFDALFSRLVDMRRELQTPGVAEAWVESIDELGRRARLSAGQVAVLKQVITDLSAVRDTQLPDNLQGRGVTTAPAADDAATGILASGERETLIAAMDEMNLDDIGKIYAGLILKGVQDTPLGQLIGGYLRDQAQAIEDALLTGGGATQNLTGTGERRGVRDESGRAASQGDELTFLTDDQVRGIGVQSEEVQQDFFDIESAIEHAVTLGRDELDQLLRTSGLLPAQVARITAAWEEFHQVADLPVADIEARFEGWAARVDTLVADLEDGAITQEDFNQQALDAIPALERLAQAADARGFATLAGYYRAAASGLSDLVTGAGTVTQTLTTAEQQAADTTISLLALTTRYREGAIGQEEFNTAGVAALKNLDAQALAAERAKNPELAAYFRELAANLRDIGGAGLKAAETFDAFVVKANTAQATLNRATRRGPAGGNAARADLVDALKGQMTILQTDLDGGGLSADQTSTKLEKLRELAVQMEDVRLGFTIEIAGFDTGISAFDTLKTAAGSLGNALDSNFQKVAQGSMTMGEAVSASVAAMTVNVVSKLQEQIIATATAALITDVLTGNWAKAAVDTAIIAGAGIGGGLLKGALTPTTPTIQNPAGSGISGGNAGAAARAASSAPAITYHLEMVNNWTITEGLDSPGTRQKLVAMQEQAALRVMDRAGLIKLPAALPAV